MPGLAAVLLAAGRSSRFGEENKLLANADGRPMVRAVAEMLQAPCIENVVVVTGHEAEAVQDALEGLAVRFDWAALGHKRTWSPSADTSVLCQ